MTAAEPYRPTLHFAPRAGWINDPNGLIRRGDTWHLFFQYDPDSTTHGPMHWGHATSTDLLHWQEHPIALYPDELGTCFSGSAIETPAGETKLFFTAHRKIDGRDFQVQCLAHADPAVMAFTRDPANPVLPNPGLVAFRDPKVIWHAPTNRWIMLVTVGQSIGFYGSDDLTHWTALSTFGEGEGRHSEGPWECPDLVPLTAPDGTTRWVLIVGVNPGSYASGSGTQYFVGDFDGTRFVNANPPQTELWLDHGRDYYAAQTFFDTRPAGGPLAIAWASNWEYARQTPTVAFRGSMSLPRELRLVDTADGWRVAAGVPAPLAATFAPIALADLPATPTRGTYRINGTIDLTAGQSAGITLFGEAEPQVRFTRDASGDVTLRLTRSAHADMPGFAHDYIVPLGRLDAVAVELFVDNGLMELCLDHGRVWATQLHFPHDLRGRIALLG